MKLAKLKLNELEKIAELSAILLNGAIIEKDIKITTENASVARRIFNLIKDLYNINCSVTIRKGINHQKKSLYILQTKNKDILNDLGIYDKHI